MANIYTNEVYAFGPASALKAFIEDRHERAGEVAGWVSSTEGAPLWQTYPDLKDYVEVVFTSSAEELDGLMAELSERHQEIVITHAAAELVDGIAYAQVWSGGLVVGEYVMDALALETCGTEQAVFDDLHSKVDACEKDAIRALAADLVP